MRWIFFGCLIAVNLSSSAQKIPIQNPSAYVVQSERIEFEVNENSDHFHIINGFEEGLLIINKQLNKVSDGKIAWKMQLLDSELNVSWEKSVMVPSGSVLLGWDFANGHFFLLFSRTQYKEEELLVFKIEAYNGHHEVFTISTVFPIKLSHFEAIDDFVILGGTANERPVVINYNLQNRIPVVVSGIYDLRNNIEDIILNNDNTYFSVILSELFIEKQQTIAINTYSLKNELIDRKVIDPGEKINLIEGTTLDFSSEVQYMAGTYSLKSKESSRGLYLSRFDIGKQTFIKYFDYASLEFFFEYRGLRREQRLRKRIDARSAEGKNSSYSYKLIIHDLMANDSQLLLIGEAYYTRHPNHTDFSLSNLRRAQVFSNLEHVYTHTIIVALDTAGTILWDHSFPMSDVVSDFPTEKVVVNVKGDCIELLYLEKNLIRSKVISGANVLESNAFTPIMLGKEDDNWPLKDPILERLEKWYEDYLFAYGEQEIISSKGTENVFRKVFYINKIGFDHNDAFK
jgi:hypothetical protein